MVEENKLAMQKIVEDSPQDAGSEQLTFLLNELNNILGVNDTQVEIELFKNLGMIYHNPANEALREQLINSIATVLSGITGENKDHQLNLKICNIFRADVSLGMDVAMGMGMNMDSIMNGMSH